MTKSATTTAATKSVLSSQNTEFKKTAHATTSTPVATAAPPTVARASTPAPTTPAWITKAAEAVEGIAWVSIPGLSRPRNYRNYVEEPVPDEDFTFTISNADKYAFQFTDGHEDTGGEGLGNLTGNWDQHYGTNYEYGWELLPFFDVTVTQVHFRITIEARLTKSPLELANYLLDNDIPVKHLDQ